MPFLDNIITGLNTGLTDTLACHAPSRIFGIAETMQIAEEDDEGLRLKRYPGIFGNDGEVQMIDIDDGQAITIYHRLESITNSIDTNTAFGSSFGNSKEVVNMSLIFFGFRDRIIKPAYFFEALIKDGFPDSSKIQSIQQSYYRQGNTSFDLLSLLSREYTAKLNYPLLTGFEMKYRIENTYKKGCFINVNGC